MKKIAVYCSTNCCGNNPCYLDTKIAMLSTLPYERCSNQDITRYKVDKSPTILLLDGDKLVKKIEGKLLDSTISRAIKSLGW